MKNLLIISPTFPPNNAADMHRVRQGVNYWKEFGWNPIVVGVAPHLTEFPKEEILLQTVPEDLEIHHVKAFSAKYTRKVGLGELGLRSMYFYRKKVNQIIRQKQKEGNPIELIYFSTTVFPICVLGAYWKRKFKIPYIIDMQDPWHSDYYLTRPKAERPPKFWFSYNLHKFLEPIAMKKVDGIVSVSEGYCQTLQKRYQNITPQTCITLPFGAFDKDFEVANKMDFHNKFFNPKDDFVHLVYIGRGGHDLKTAAQILFKAISKGLKENPTLFKKLKLFFIGTDYSSQNPKPTIFPVAQQIGVQTLVEEFPARIPYFDTLRLLSEANGLLIFGSIDKNYTASKLYPYILSEKPICAVFYEGSSAVSILRKTNAGTVIPFLEEKFDEDKIEEAYITFKKFLENIEQKPQTDWQAFEPYTAREMTRKQAEFFDKIIEINE
ncbi:hypothetical protein [Bernardetia sp.]|uniref:hypothetical protein n=1 Tax=Bernardetia sp. TaxID=1937974 RepID=UPI0025BA532F|nr:hypothetical protein [Bernardetia sp.]